MSTKILVWGENYHEKHDPTTQKVYPNSIHETIATGLRHHLGDSAVVETATMDDPEHGLTEERLSQTDVLFWWGHAKHDEVATEVVDRVQRHVLSGMGLVVLHSAHFSRIFIRLMGTTCSLRWRASNDREVVWTVAPTHPIAEGVPQPIVIPAQEMYGEEFDVPVPDDLVFISNFSGGEVFRSGMTYTRGRGRIFYFSPGDQGYPVYHDPSIQLVLANAARWAHQERERTLPRLEMYADDEFFVPGPRRAKADA